MTRTLVSVDLLKTGVPIHFSHFIIPCPPFLSSMATPLPCDCKSGLNPVPPPLQDMPLLILKTGMTTLKTRPIRPLANLSLDRITNRIQAPRYTRTGELGRRPGWEQVHITAKKDHAWDSSDDDDGIDFADQEDKTVRRLAKAFSPSPNTSPPPPVPSAPSSPRIRRERHFPGSPTLSVFSIPSGRESVNTYSSLAHLPLRGGNASALAMLPPSPPAQKPRGAYERSRVHLTTMSLRLLDRRQDIAPLPSPPQSSSPNQGPVDIPPSFRIFQLFQIFHLVTSRVCQEGGVSVKRFTSPGPSDAAEGAQAERDATPRAAASRARSPSRTPSWFFRSSRARLIRRQALH
jgi:hypothetical protein